MSEMDEDKIADMIAFGASEAAPYLYPEADQQSVRAAYCDGAAQGARALLRWQGERAVTSNRSATRLKYYPDYIDDPDGLERFRQAVLSNDGHDMAAVNHNSLGRLIDTIERLRRERDAALATPATSA